MTSALTKLKRSAEAIWTWLLEHTDGPADGPRPWPVTAPGPRPSPATGEAWLVSGADHTRQSVVHRTGSDDNREETAKHLVNS